MHGVGEGVHCRRVGDIDCLREHLAAEGTGSCRGLVESGFVAVAEDERRAASGAEQGGGAADAAAGAGDEDDLAVEIPELHG